MGSRRGAVLIASLAFVLILGCGGEPGRARVRLQDPSPTAAAATPSVSVPAEASPAGTPTGVVELAAVGDVMLARSVGERILAAGPDGVFAGVGTVLSDADLAIANLETSVSDRGAPQPKGYTFRAPPSAVEALLAGGIDAVSLANNHSLDYGPEALADTVTLLKAAGIASAGAGNTTEDATAPAILERNGLRIALLSFVDVQSEGTGFSRETWEATADRPGVAWADDSTIRAAVAAASSVADIIIVALHSGTEYATVPTAAQRSYAHAAIDAGADLVLGHHPHVLQEVEEYGDGVIAYSLGNFVFDGFDGAANSTAIFRATLTAEGVADWELVPASVIDGLPVLDE